MGAFLTMCHRMRLTVRVHFKLYRFGGFFPTNINVYRNVYSNAPWLCWKMALKKTWIHLEILSFAWNCYPTSNETSGVLLKCHVAKITTINACSANRPQRPSGSNPTSCADVTYFKAWRPVGWINYGYRCGIPGDLISPSGGPLKGECHLE